MTNLGNWAFTLRNMAEEIREERDCLKAQGRATKKVIEHLNTLAGHLDKAASEIEEYLKKREKVAVPVWDLVDDEEEEAREAV